jgi:pimeloyl-ACP methyl ester carboxylesterase
MVPSDSAWRNACPARIFLTLPLYRPIARASRVTCPALLYGAEGDSLIPFTDLERCAARLPNGRLERFSGGHFDVYEGNDFRRAVQVYLGFLREHLLAP